MLQVIATMIFVLGSISGWSFIPSTLHRVSSHERKEEKTSNILEDTKKYPYFLCVAAIFKDEAPYFKEWIEYHKLLGVEHFRLYNNDSTDDYLSVLRPYMEKGEVTLVDWPSDPEKLGPDCEWVWTTQLPALTDAIVAFQGVSKWLAIIDIDEFIVPLQHRDIPSFLENYEEKSGVLINWQNFGTSDVWDVPYGKLLIETLTWKAKEKDPLNHPVKSIIKPDRIDVFDKAWCPHTWPYLNQKEPKIVSTGESWKFGMIDVSQIRINHYVHRTDRYFYEQKVRKKERMEGKKLSQQYIQTWKNSCNQVKDTKIFSFVPELRKRVFFETKMEE